MPMNPAPHSLRRLKTSSTKPLPLTPQWRCWRIPAAGTPLSGKALEYASEAFRINEQSRARSLLDLLSETDAAITEGVPAELLKRKQENLDRQQDIADILTGINVSTEELKKKPAELDAELEKLQTEYEEIENQIRTASPRYATLTANKPLTLAEVQRTFSTIKQSWSSMRCRPKTRICS